MAHDVEELEPRRKRETFGTGAAVTLPAIRVENRVRHAYINMNQGDGEQRN